MSSHARCTALQIARLAGRAIQLEQAHEVRRHLVRLAVGDFVHSPLRQERGEDLRTRGLVPGAHDVAAELEIAGVAGETVERRHRLEHAGVGHADVPVVAGDALPAVTVPPAQQIADAPGRGQRRLEPGALVVVQERQQVVLVRPHVPERQALGWLELGVAVVLEAIGFEVCAEIAVVELRRQQVADRAIELRLQPRVAGVCPGVGCRVDELADVLADPRLLSGPLPVAFQQRLGIHAFEQALVDVDRHAVAEQALDALCAERGRRIPGLHGVRHGPTRGQHLLAGRRRPCEVRA